MKKQKLSLNQLTVKSFTTGNVKGGVAPSGHSEQRLCISGGESVQKCLVTAPAQCDLTTIWTPSGPSCPECAYTVFETCNCTIPTNDICESV